MELKINAIHQAKRLESVLGELARELPRHTSKVCATSSPLDLMPHLVPLPAGGRDFQRQ
jgi:hypothetical protein